jgi:hypothetical protein
MLSDPQAATLEAAFFSANQGFSVESRGRKSACLDRTSFRGRQPATSTELDRKNSPAFASSTAMRFVENGSVLVGMLPSGPVRREAVLVDDMKEIAHAAR